MTKELIERLRDTASKGVSVWGDLQMEAADALEQAHDERDDLAYRLRITQEKGRCQCADDDACAFAQERDALQAKNQVLLHELNYIAGISNGQVKRVAEQEIAQVVSKVVSGLPPSVEESK